MSGGGDRRAPDRRRVLRGGALAAAWLAGGRALAAPAVAAPPAVPSVMLSPGVAMPMLGFGTYSLRGALCEESVADAITAGYRLIDTAFVYGNEEAVGAGIRKAGVPRQSLFVTSKIWVDDSGYAPAKRAFQATLDRLGLDYLDLYLIHRPRGDVAGSWRAMEELHEAGRIRAIGVSNFDAAQRAALAATARIAPVLNQIETHPYFQEDAAFAARAAGTGPRIEAWAPLAEGRNGLFTDPVLAAIATAHKRSVAQIVLRWHHQRDTIVIPRSSNPAHRRENLRIFDFALSDEEMRRIAARNLGRSLFPEWT
ncbi:aldo/keto reductase [Sphingomonas morindae]|uniref:Aldo/keto reductase n=1 Tax=Sphingomonas morindae TaxID=1541170 RepID=A0ABY4X923_9SPHN|nr:aldo/keto reductase [Sphingomonas morindae]USI73405.1 aldo/keto reductase [Sphingomonas morindae]